MFLSEPQLKATKPGINRSPALYCVSHYPVRCFSRVDVWSLIAISSPQNLARRPEGGRRCPVCLLLCSASGVVDTSSTLNTFQNLRFKCFFLPFPLEECLFSDVARASSPANSGSVSLSANGTGKEIARLRSLAFLHYPGGRSENSPTFQRWGSDVVGQSKSRRDG